MKFQRLKGRGWMLWLWRIDARHGHHFRWGIGRHPLIGFYVVDNGREYRVRAL